MVIDGTDECPLLNVSKTPLNESEVTLKLILNQIFSRQITFDPSMPNDAAVKNPAMCSPGIWFILHPGLCGIQEK